MMSAEQQIRLALLADINGRSPDDTGSVMKLRDAVVYLLLEVEKLKAAVPDGDDGMPSAEG